MSRPAADVHRVIKAYDVRGLVGEEIDDSYSVSRATDVAYEFSVRRRGPSHLYTKTEPAALRNFDTFCKPTFSTKSALFGLNEMSESSPQCVQSESRRFKLNRQPATSTVKRRRRI